MYERGAFLDSRSYSQKSPETDNGIVDEESLQREGFSVSSVNRGSKRLEDGYNTYSDSEPKSVHWAPGSHYRSP
jgi:hypothetical protein